jgi:isopenicillin N synthase-like dioxygenase
MACDLLPINSVGTGMLQNHQDSSILPVIDISFFLQNPSSQESLQEIQRLTEALKEFGAFGLRDSRVSEQDNDSFLDLMEDYFESDKSDDIRPHLSYQVGATPSGIELPRVSFDLILVWKRCRLFKTR